MNSLLLKICKWISPEIREFEDICDEHTAVCDAANIVFDNGWNLDGEAFKLSHRIHIRLRMREKALLSIIRSK